MNEKPVTSTCPSRFGSREKNEQCIASGPGHDMYESVEIVGRLQFDAAKELMDGIASSSWSSAISDSDSDSDSDSNSDSNSSPRPTEAMSGAVRRRARHQRHFQSQQDYRRDPLAHLLGRRGQAIAEQATAEHYTKATTEEPLVSALSGRVDFVHRFVNMSAVAVTNGSGSDQVIGRTCRPAMVSE